MNPAEMSPDAYAASVGMTKTAAASEHVSDIRLAMLSRTALDELGMRSAQARRPIHVDAVSAYGVFLPAGYKRDGNMFVWSAAA